MLLNRQHQNLLPTMHEWVAVTAIGAMGGMGAALFHGGDKNKGWWEGYIWPLILNGIAGAFGSFILWATYTSSLDFNSTKFTPGEIGASLILGLGGVSTVRGYLHETREANKWEKAAKGNAAAAAELEAADKAGIDASDPTLP
jgi:uncharacterized membrane protein YeaQ/YmgE (transglycosylase-associated protein family)